DATRGLIDRLLLGKIIHIDIRRQLSSAEWTWLAIGRRLDDIEIAEDALKRVLKFLSIAPLLVAERLAASAHVESAQLDTGTESFRKISVEEHRVEKLDESKLQRHCFVKAPGLGQIEHSPHQLRHDTAGRIGAAVGAHQHHRDQHNVPAGQEREIRPY